MTDLNALLAPYDYELPPELIASSPADPRDGARLLVFNRATGETSFDTFHNITAYLPADSVLVFNRTKVIPARVHLTKETGGMVEALYLGIRGGELRMMIGGKVKQGDRLRWFADHFLTVKHRDGKYATLIPSFPPADLHRLLLEHGETPLPPYMKDSPLSEAERRRQYQTVYARDEGSVAAPTAGLHFTEELMMKIEEHGCAIAYVTLHVNLGTFAPLTQEHMKEKRLHEEWYEIDADTAAYLNEAKKEGRPIIAVGTTTVRTLESATVESRLEKLAGVTDIFITENDALRFVDGLVTNFHVPRSSLLMLVSAFTGREKLMKLYARAIEEKYRFFSFGDGMLIA